MKKLALQFAMMLLTFIGVKAQQQLTNAGFENWDTIADYTQPKHWYSLNPLTAFGFDQTTTLTTNAHSGVYAVVLETKANSNQNIPGLLTTGPVITSSGNADFNHLQIKFTSKPVNVRFYFKCYPKKEDTSVFVMVLTKWNANQAKNDTVATANFIMTDSVSNYTQAIVPFAYHSALQPDSAFILASSSRNGFNPTIGSKFILDDITLEYTPAGLSANENRHSSVMYPNPSDKIVNIDFDQSAAHTIMLYDNAGRMVFSKQGTNQNNTVDLNRYEAGLYTLLIQYANNKTEFHKLILQH